MQWHPGLINQIPPGITENRGFQIGAQGLRPANPGVHRSVFELLVAGIRVTQASFDYADAADEFEIGFAKEAFQKGNQAIRFEAHQTVRDFNAIVAHLGGIPVKVLSTQTDGLIKSVERYHDGVWTWAFEDSQRNKSELHSDIDTLHTWHRATMPDVAAPLQEVLPPDELPLISSETA